MVRPGEQIANFLTELTQSGSLDSRLDPVEGELGEVIVALNGFLDKLWLKDFQLSAKQEMLEKVVEIRTKEVHEILDNVSSGFLIALSDEVVLDNYSRSCVSIFGREKLRGLKISELMGLSERDRLNFAACYSQIFDDVLPVELALDQLPSEFRLGEHSFRIQGSPIHDGHHKVTKVFFTITDTTELRRAEAENAVRLALLEIVRQKETFREFLFETSRAFEQARSRPTQHTLRSLLHTIKGNLGCYGLHDIASLIHSIEDVAEVSLRDLQRVEDALRKFMSLHQDILGLEYPESQRRPRSVDIQRLMPLFDALVSAGEPEVRQALIARFVEHLSWVPAGVLLSPLSGVVERTAERLGKEVSFAVIGAEVLVDPDWIGPLFSSLVHVIRNSVDHGIEVPDERGAKNPRGSIWVEVREDAESWEIRVEDDGRGLDGARIGQAALARGLVSAEELEEMSERERQRLLFRDGVSTKEDVDMVSGRGVGASAVLDAVTALGGSVEIVSRRGQGTGFRLVVPKRSSDQGSQSQRAA
ncbi:MAG: ATP-binding protein [Myxococcota bacterium]